MAVAETTPAEGVCIGIDVGGTFTDAVLTDGRQVWRAKAPTTKGDLGQGVLAACRLASARAGLPLEELLPKVSRFGLGTTAVTNVLATRSGPPIGLVTTAGFEDMVPLSKGRTVLEDGWVVNPPPIVPRNLVVGVDERIDHDGHVLRPLDPEEAVAAARRLVDEEHAEAIAVSFLWSFKNPRHEEMAVAGIGHAFPDLTVFSGAAVNPVMREFERTTFALLNAYVGGAYAGIDALGDELARLGLTVPLLLVHSGGGSITAPEARRIPIGLAASGPAAGVAASVSLVHSSAREDAITCDMGGTSFDVSVISRGQASRRSRGDLAGIWTAMPQIDVESIGAGGGSIGWVDARGMLRVGPQSAGAVPGPACYGKGGTEPTVTDALVVLGYIDPTMFLGGEMALDVDAAYLACESVGQKLGLTARETAWGIRELSLAGMIKAVRSMLNARGLDPRDQALISFGGCGSLFTPEIARAIGATDVLVPELASVLSAFGAATADIRRDRVHSLGLTMPIDIGALQALAEKLEAEVLADLAADGVHENDRSVMFEFDLRFKRQISELAIPLASRALDDAALDHLTEEFRTEYARRYGQGSIVLGAPMELVNLRAVGLGRTIRASLDTLGRATVPVGTPAPRAGSRNVQVGRGDDGSQAVPTFYASELQPGHRVDGPALIDGPDTTIWIPPDSSATLDERSTLVVDVRADGAALQADAAGAATKASRSVTDPIALELLRSRLEAVAEDAAVTIERTGVSPTATETHDLSATLLDAEGNLVAGGGWVSYHWVAATQAVRSTIARYGDDIRSGDVFFANDPYNGGGLHPNDVFVERPIFIDDRLVAWVALSAHLADMGGMASGSFAPTATECYQEAFRVPSVRLFRAGEEVSDVWDLLRCNVRMPWVVEMDLRALVAGGHVAQEKVSELVDTVGLDFFLDGMTALQDLSEQELRKRIEAMPDGTYRACTWVDWDDELYYVPCSLTIEGDHMVFDFEGASPQAPHFFNSQPYIIKSSMVMQFARSVAADLPYTEGLLAPIEIRCPEGTIVNAKPPAPMNAGHMHVGATASEMMLQCVRFALWASSPPLDASRFVHGWGGSPLMSLAIWSGTDVDGHATIWGMVDGTWSGGTGTTVHDGPDLGVVPVGMDQTPSSTDVEVIESWYPLLVLERSVRAGVNGAGEHRSGGGTQMKLQPYSSNPLSAQMLGTREWLPLEGVAGGFPGSTTVYEITRSDGTVERVSTKAAGIALQPGETFEFRAGSSGGAGDPLDRDPLAVANDVAVGRINGDDAVTVYGVLIDGDGDGAVDDVATDARRAEMRADRLARASAPPRPVSDDDVAQYGKGEAMPLYPGIVQRGAVAYAERSGTPLTLAPDHWTEGCAVLEEPLPERGPGREIVVRAYLDPRTGRSLYVESVPAGEVRAFEISPKRWTDARAS